MALKISLFFQLIDQGWSEVYINNDNDPLEWLSSIILFPSIPPATTSPTAFIRARLRMLSPGAFLKHIRASVFNSFRNEQAIDLDPSQGAGQYPVIPATEVFSSLLIQYGGSASGSRRVHRNGYLGGIPEDIITPPAFFNNTIRWRAAFADFRAVMISGQWAMSTRGLPADASPLLAFTPTADGRQALAEVAGPALATGVKSQVVLRGIKDPHGWNGTHTAYTADSTVVPGRSAFLVGPTRKAQVTVPPFVPGGSGTLQVQGLDLVGINTLHTVRIVDRKRGRPFGLEVGRRSRP